VDRRLLAVLFVLLAWGYLLLTAPFAGATPLDNGPSDDGSPVNTVIAENTSDGTSVFDLAFDVRTITGGSTVAPGNVAIAMSSCSNCQTVAIAVQVVFVIGSPDVFAPENGAVAVNADCSFCDTLATAYQFVVQSSVPVRFTHEGKKQLHDIYKQLQALEGTGLTATEIQARVDDLMQQMADVLATEVEVAPGERVGQQADPDSARPSSTTTTATTVVTSTSTSTSTSTTTTSSTTTSTTTTTAPVSSTSS
jgi:putative peptide zinc metalloprotease protein